MQSKQSNIYKLGQSGKPNQRNGNLKAYGRTSDHCGKQFITWWPDIRVNTFRQCPRSRGSVIPIFINQIRKGMNVTVTDQEMTRFIMSIKQATSLVIDSAEYAKGGEVFVTKMPSIRIHDLARIMIEELGPRYGYAPEDLSIDIIGSKPGKNFTKNCSVLRKHAAQWSYPNISPYFLPSEEYTKTLIIHIKKHYQQALTILTTQQMKFL